MPRALYTAWDFLCRITPIYFEWVQVDPSTRVVTGSPFHPAMAYGDSWVARDLPFPVFSRLVPVLERTRNVFLHGWGDPFANPSFFNMARICKEKRCNVHTATRGGLLDASDWDRVVEAGIDRVSFPIDGLTDRSSMRRTGHSLDDTREAIALLHAAKGRANSDKPDIDIRYTLTRSRLDEVLNLPAFLLATGVDMAMVTTPSFVPTAELADECLVPRRPQQFRWLLSHLDSLYYKGLEHGQMIHYFVMSPGKRRRQCIENVTETIFVGVDGSVSPCAVRQLPLRKAVTHWYLGEDVDYEPLVFGSLAEFELDEIWHSKPYRRFRTPFYWNRISRRCDTCLTPFRVHG